MLRDESCHCTNVCKVLFQIFASVITDLKISSKLENLSFVSQLRLDIKRKRGSSQHDLQYHADKNEPIWVYGFGMLVNTLSKSFRLSGATKTF